MIFVIRTTAGQHAPESRVRVIRMRATPPVVAEMAGQQDVFCIGDEPIRDQLQADGWSVVPLHDGWYADDQEGGIAVWGNGRYWEVRATPFDVIAQG